MKLFRSVRFNVGLFTALALASAVGTLLPQRHEAPAKVETFLEAHPSLGPVMDRAGLFHLYYSGWYVALLGLMAFDVLVCKLRALPEEDRLSSARVAASPLKFHFETGQPLRLVAEKIKASLKRRHYTLREGENAGEIHLWAVKHRLQLWGDFVLHVSVVAILLGALFGSVKGFEEFLPVTAGEERPMKNRPWRVAVDEFVVDYYKNTRTPRAYASRLRVLDEGRAVAQKRVVVNDPLDIGGVRFYQASWGMTGMVRSATLEIPRPDGHAALIHIPKGELVPLNAAGLSVSADRLYPDFHLDASGRPNSRSLEPNNPAVLISFYQKNRRVASLWLLDRHPDVCFKVLPDQTAVPAAQPPFRLKHFDPVLFSGIQITYDPGVKIVAYGCLLLLAGLVLHFYLHQRRIRISLKANQTGTEARFAGWSSRSPMDFDPEWRSLRDSVTAGTAHG